MDSRFFFAVFLTILSALTVSGSAQAQDNSRFYIDLQKFPLYVKADFNPSDAVSPDLQDGSWLAKEQWSNAVIRRLGLPGLPKRIFGSPWGRPEQEWTFVIPFTMDASVLDDNAPIIPCLYLASIGINWEIYLNGDLIKKEMHLATGGKAAGRITEQHYDRNVIVPINSSLLQKGKNVLAFRIMGDPTDYTTGFTYQSPYYLADYEYITRRHNESAKIILISILALLGIYHFLFYAIFREERYSLACGFFTANMSLYYLWRTHWIHQLIPNTAVLMKLEYFTVYFIILALMAYTDKLCNARYSIVTKIYGVFCLILAVTNLFFSRTYGSEAAAVWQIASLFALLWIYIHNIIFPFNRELKKGKKFVDTLINTYPGNLLIAVTFVILTGGFDLVDSLALHYSFALTRFGIVVFTLTITFMLFRMFVLKNSELKEKSALLENAANPASAREKVFVQYDLTEREKEIARLMVEGLDNNDIGERLFVASSTIAFHVTNIFRKFGIIDGKNKGRAVFLAKLIGG